MDCIFCSIIKGEIPSSKIWDDEMCYAFLDINPQAPVHCLVVPKLHISSAEEIKEEKRLQEEKAQDENQKLYTEQVGIDEIDDDAIHIDEHVRYVLSEYQSLTEEQKQRYYQHVLEHKQQLKQGEKE